MYQEEPFGLNGFLPGVVDWHQVFHLHGEGGGQEFYGLQVGVDVPLFDPLDGSYRNLGFAREFLLGESLFFALVD